MIYQAHSLIEGPVVDVLAVVNHGARSGDGRAASTATQGRYRLPINTCPTAVVVYQLLTGNAVRSPWNGLQALGADIRFAFQANTIRTVCNSAESASQFVVTIGNELKLADRELTIGQISDLIQCICATFYGNLISPEKRHSKFREHSFECCPELLEFSVSHAKFDGKMAPEIQIFRYTQGHCAAP